MTDRSTAITIDVNGETRHAARGATLADFLTEIGLDGRKIAIERNLAVVPRSLYTTTRLESGDRLEIVHFIGGG